MVPSHDVFDVPGLQRNVKLQLGLERKCSRSSASFPLKLIYRPTDLIELKLDKSFDVGSEKVGRIMYQN